ncbi:TetR family transcriptional regulator [Nocardiopsis sp. TSRI0078]|uniref:TetR family transcriptional regulator n=2 Tax=unclassified Nocardiopsis TaxID=2649073 RepID=UPI0009F876C8|nr:TetR family transcriptional regulator [Nocardiopsis sp. TSRI0078]
MRLTVEHGFDQVTVEAIAEAANISRRTFSNYFACKGDAVLYGERLYTRALVDALRERPADEGAWTALRACARDLYASWSPWPDRGWALRTRMARKHPSLLARQLTDHAVLARELEESLAGRARPGGPRPGLLVAVFLAGLRVGLDTWIDEEESRDLLEVVEEVLDEAEASFDR